EVHAKLDDRAEGGYRRVVVGRVAPDVRPGNLHRAESQPVDGQVAAKINGSGRCCVHATDAIPPARTLSHRMVVRDKPRHAAEPGLDGDVRREAGNHRVGLDRLSRVDRRYRNRVLDRQLLRRKQAGEEQRVALRPDPVLPWLKAPARVELDLELLADPAALVYAKRRRRDPDVSERVQAFSGDSGGLAVVYHSRLDGQR